MVPEQLSVVVGAVAVAEHSPVTSAKTGVNGSSLSVTVTVKLHSDPVALPSRPISIKRNSVTVPSA